MRPGYFIQSGLRGHDREESLKLISKLLPSSLVLVRSDFRNEEDLKDLIDSIRKIYVIENGADAPHIAVDQEGGNVVRIPWIDYNPSNFLLGEIGDLAFTKFVGSKTGYDLLQLGVRWNLAPVLDTANPYNPVILERGFSSRADLVALHGEAYIKGIQQSGVAATAKHFPGHGGVTKDSHLELPTDERPITSIRNDVSPYVTAIGAGVSAVMMSHVVYTSLDPDYPASLSGRIYNYLRKELSFDGVIITDSIEMKALSRNYSPKEIAKLATHGGADIVEAVDLDKAIEISTELDMVDKNASAERIGAMIPETRLGFVPPDDIISSTIISNVRVLRAFDFFDTKRATDLVLLDDTRESLVADSFTNSKQFAERIKPLNLPVRISTSDPNDIAELRADQIIIVGRNEHLRSRSDIITKIAFGKRAVFVSTGVPYDLAQISPHIGYISAMTTRVEGLLGALYRIFGMY